MQTHNDTSAKVQGYTDAAGLFEALTQLATHAEEDSQTIKAQLYEILSIACDHALYGSNHAYGSLMAKIDHIGKLHRIQPSHLARIQSLRQQLHAGVTLAAQDVPYCCRVVALLVSAVFDTAIPQPLLSHTPDPETKPLTYQKVDYKCIRAIVKELTDSELWVQTDNMELANDHANDNRQWCKLSLKEPHLQHLKDLLKPDMQVNLVDCRWDNEQLVADMIVLEPDFLVDISGIARCFTDYGHHPINYFVQRFRPVANSQAILLGNFAGAALDDIITGNGTYDWKNTLKKHFKRQATAYCTCQDLNQKEPFAMAAQKQARHIEEIVNDLFKKKNGAYQADKALLEPSFVCETLGLQGRVDLMTTDFKLLVEQKSGGNYYIERSFPNAYGGYHKEDHYVQLLLYYGVLQANFNLSRRHSHINLLYSKYPLPQGLVVVSYYKALLAEALALRNRIVAIELQMAQEGMESILPLFTIETLNEKQLSTAFFHQYIRPSLESVLLPLQQANDLKKAYFCTMMNFVAREQLASKVGIHNNKGNAIAALWNMPLTEKRETGNIFTGLTPLPLTEQTVEGTTIDQPRFAIPSADDSFLPNFRIGDSVYLYAYHEKQQPDVRHHILYKGVIAGMSPCEIAVQLNQAIPVNSLFVASSVFAIEHGGSDMGTTMAYRGLHSMLCTTPQRADLLLGQRSPERDVSKTLLGKYDEEETRLLTKAIQAKDYFLLVGPPGAGKTSRALCHLVYEEMERGGTLLLTAYTNRAVDEICEMLTQADYPFIRVGNKYSCDPRYRSSLVDCFVEAYDKLDTLKAALSRQRIIVGTTSSLQAQPHLLSLLHFSLAIVDEASQILEPHILGLLTLGHSTPCVDKFILIGDHKQLPAVVQQAPSESQVNHPLLRSIALENCRESLFERLLRWEKHQHRSEYIGILHKQGRMHPEVAAFATRMFYAKEKLGVVPLKHQTETVLPYKPSHPDALDNLLTNHRMLFFSSESLTRMKVFLPSYDRLSSDPVLGDKVNASEALLVAAIVLRIQQYYGSLFDPNTTLGIIVPYRNQIAMIRKALYLLGLEDIDRLSIDTVERYQGSQRDVIIYSFTITKSYQLDFLTANSFEEEGKIIDRKLNVALTRSRRQTILLGNETLLRHNELFAALIDSCYRA